MIRRVLSAMTGREWARAGLEAAALIAAFIACVLWLAVAM